MNVVGFTDFEASSVILFNDKLTKMPQNMKSSDSFRTVFDSAVVCQLFQAPCKLKQNPLFRSPIDYLAEQKCPFQCEIYLLFRFGTKPLSFIKENTSCILSMVNRKALTKESLEA